MRRTDHGYLPYKDIGTETDLRSSLTALRIANRQDSTVRRRAEELVEEAARHPDMVRGLDLGFCDLTEVSNEVARLTKLEELRLAGNDLTWVPAGVGRLEVLRVLHLDDNKVERMPDEMGNLTALQQLILHTNRLTTLPATCTSLINMIDLDLYDNKIKDAGAADIMHIFRGHSQLLRLALCYNEIGVAGCNCVAGMLDTNPRLMRLDLEGNIQTHPSALQLRDRVNAAGRGYDNSDATEAEIRRQLAVARDLSTARLSAQMVAREQRYRFARLLRLIDVGRASVNREREFWRLLEMVFGKGPPWSLPLELQRKIIRIAAGCKLAGLQMKDFVLLGSDSDEDGVVDRAFRKMRIDF